LQSLISLKLEGCYCDLWFRCNLQLDRPQNLFEREFFLASSVSAIYSTKVTHDIKYIILDGDLDWTGMETNNRSLTVWPKLFVLIEPKFRKIYNIGPITRLAKLFSKTFLRFFQSFFRWLHYTLLLLFVKFFLYCSFFFIRYMIIVALAIYDKS